jgi:crossover junction endodeoxyribonuclease RuvC
MTISQTIGIDPGKTGAVACLTTNENGTGTLDVWDMPINENTGDPCPHTLDLILKDCRQPGSTVHAYVEKVASRPGQGVVSTFNFGVGFGIVLAAVAIRQIAMTLVPPATWKPRLKIRSGGTKTQKKHKAMERASELLPHCETLWPLKKHDGRAEAALIALYGHLSEGNKATIIEARYLNGEGIS